MIRSQLNRYTRPLAIATLALITTTAIAGDWTPPAGPDGVPPHGQHWGPPGGGGMAAHMVLKHASQLGLSSEQVDTIKGFAASARTSSEPMHKQMKAQMMALMTTTPDDPNYSTVVATAAQTIGSLTSQAITQESQVRSQVWSVLTAAQRAKLTEMQATMHKYAELHAPPPAN